MIQINMTIAAAPNQLSDRQMALLRQQMRKQCIARNIKRRAQKDILTAAIQQAAQLCLMHIKLRQTMARRERHPPRAHIVRRRLRFIRKSGEIGGVHESAEPNPRSDQSRRRPAQASNAIDSHKWAPDCLPHPPIRPRWLRRARADTEYWYRLLETRAIRQSRFSDEFFWL